MPPRITVTGTAGDVYAPVFTNALLGLQQVVVDISELTTNEVDPDGYLKPGVAFKKDGTLCDGTSGEYVWAVNPEPQLIGHATIPPTNTSLLADTGTVPLGMGTIGEVNRDIAEDNMGRAYNSNELAAFNAAGSMIHLTNT
jgi:hypothetical protein